MLVYMFYALGGLALGLAFLGKRIGFCLAMAIIMAWSGYEVALTMEAVNAVHTEWRK